MSITSTFIYFQRKTETDGVLNEKQRAELEDSGAATIRLKLVQYGAGRGASISGFKCGDITRGDIEDWLAEKNLAEAAQQSATLFYAKIAAWAGIISVIVTAIGIWLQK